MCKFANCLISFTGNNGRKKMNRYIPDDKEENKKTFAYKTEGANNSICFHSNSSI